MGDMSDDNPKRVHLRNVGGERVLLHDWCRPRPALVEPDAIVEVDEAAVAPLVDSAAFKRATKADAAAAEQAAAERAAELAAIDAPPAAEHTDTDTAES